MQITRPVIAADPRCFGRGDSRSAISVVRTSCAADDLRLFATTFAGGFLFVSLLIA